MGSEQGEPSTESHDGVALLGPEQVGGVAIPIEPLVTLDLPWIPDQEPDLRGEVVHQDGGPIPEPLPVREAVFEPPPRLRPPAGVGSTYRLRTSRIIGWYTDDDLPKMRERASAASTRSRFLGQSRSEVVAQGSGSITTSWLSVPLNTDRLTRRVLIRIEIRRHRELRFPQFGLRQPGQRESPNCLPVHVKAEQVPVPRR
jgi:hypothetical protein